MSLSMTLPLGDSPSRLALRAGDTAQALKLLQDEVRARPADARLRIYLFQLLSVLGQWDRALNQLSVVGELDPSSEPLVQTYRSLIPCERLRQEVFAGRKVPLLFGEPEPWTALLIEALLRDGKGDADAAAALRAQAFEQAPAQAGVATLAAAGTGADAAPREQAFEWIADADMRLGPVLEAIVNGRYYWVPMNRLAEVRIEPPADLRDRVWTPAQLLFANGGETVAFVPTRYAGTPLDDAALALARRTDFAEPRPGLHVGLGQRLFATEGDDVALMDLRRLRFGAA